MQLFFFSSSCEATTIIVLIILSPYWGSSAWQQKCLDYCSLEALDTCHCHCMVFASMTSWGRSFFIYFFIPLLTPPKMQHNLRAVFCSMPMEGGCREEECDCSHDLNNKKQERHTSMCPLSGWSEPSYGRIIVLPSITGVISDILFDFYEWFLELETSCYGGFAWQSCHNVRICR